MKLLRPKKKDFSLTMMYNQRQLKPVTVKKEKGESPLLQDMRFT